MILIYLVLFLLAFGFYFKKFPRYTRTFKISVAILSFSCILAVCQVINVEIASPLVYLTEFLIRR